MRKILALIGIAFAMVACDNELEQVTEQVETRAAVEGKKEDVNFRIFKDRTQSGKEKK